MEKQPFEQTAEREIDIELGSPKERFLRIKYPLSEEGEILKNKILNGENINESEIPTVENPRPELFKDLELEEGEKEKYFGPELSNIQVTKGCTHQCTFCAAGSEKEVQVMPFPAIIKIAKEKRIFDEILKAQFNDLQSLIVKESGNSITDFSKMSFDEKRDFLINNKDICKKISEIFYNHPFLKNIKKIYPQQGQINIFQFSYEKNNEENIAESFLLMPFLILKEIANNGIKNIPNYYDNDVFDYKDRTFLHSDGTPADFGDVAKLFASETRPIHITTAGWSKTDKIAQRAAEKIVQMGANFFDDNRLSINQTEIRARKNLDIYLEDILNVIETLSPIGLEILIYDNNEDPKYSEFCFKIREKINGMNTNLIKISNNAISAYSGHSKDEKHADDHHDVMACAPGIHIWPDGTIAEQPHDTERYNRAPKGSRPKPTEKVLWRN